MKFIPQVVTQTIGKSVLSSKKNSPHILFAGGMIGIVASTVLACRATLKLEPVLDEIRHDLEQVKLKDKEMAESTDVVRKERLKDLGYVYGKSAKTMGRLYGPALVVGIVSVSALTGSHIKLTRQNAALSATLAAVSKSFESYRARVAEELGEEKELDIHRGITEEKRDIDGKKELVKVVDNKKLSPYARVFDETTNNWVESSEMNRMFINAQQEYANHRLQAYGHIFLNEVYDMLGFERSSAGAVCGWIRNGDGDGYVDFGMFKAYDSRFVNQLERSIWLDFNVDGPMYDKI